MKSTPEQTPEYTNFESAMRTILRVPKADVERELMQEKQERAAHSKKRGPKPKNASDRAPGDRD